MPDATVEPHTQNFALHQCLRIHERWYQCLSLPKNNFYGLIGVGLIGVGLMTSGLIGVGFAGVGLMASGFTGLGLMASGLIGVGFVGVGLIGVGLIGSHFCMAMRINSAHV
jgi:hypothetical protein